MSYSYTRITRNSNGGGTFIQTSSYRVTRTESSQDSNIGSQAFANASQDSNASSRRFAYGKRTLQDPEIKHDLKVSLEDIYKGCIKNMRITRNIFSRDGTSRSEVKMLSVNVKPGCKDGAIFTFPKEGDQRPGHIPADITFVIKDRPHPQFEREGVNIRYIQKLTLKEALCGTTIRIPTLDDTIHTIKIDNVIKPGTTRRLAGHGLPIPYMVDKRGDLIIKFDVQFPHSLSLESKELLQKSHHHF